MSLGKWARKCCCQYEWHENQRLERITLPRMLGSRLTIAPCPTLDRDKHFSCPPHTRHSHSLLLSVQLLFHCENQFIQLKYVIIISITRSRNVLAARWGRDIPSVAVCYSDVSGSCSKRKSQYILTKHEVYLHMYCIGCCWGRRNCAVPTSFASKSNDSEARPLWWLQRINR